MATLYEIRDELTKAMDRARLEAEAFDGEVSKLIWEELDRLELAKAEKVGNICKLIKSLRADAEAIEAERGNLLARRMAKENEAGWLTNYLSVMINGEKFEDAASKITWRKSTSVDVIDVEALPEGMIRVVPAERMPNKALIKEALVAGVNVPGAALHVKNSIVIK